MFRHRVTSKDEYKPASRSETAAATPPGGWQPSSPWDSFGPRRRLVEVDGPDGTVHSRWEGWSLTARGAERKAIARDKARHADEQSRPPRAGRSGR